MTVKMGAPMPPNPMMPRQPMNPLPPPMPVPPIPQAAGTFPVSANRRKRFGDSLETMLSRPPMVASDQMANMNVFTGQMMNTAARRPIVQQMRGGGNVRQMYRDAYSSPEFKSYTASKSNTFAPTKGTPGRAVKTHDEIMASIRGSSSSDDKPKPKPVVPTPASDPLDAFGGAGPDIASDPDYVSDGVGFKYDPVVSGGTGTSGLPPIPLNEIVVTAPSTPTGSGMNPSNVYVDPLDPFGGPGPDVFESPPPMQFGDQPAGTLPMDPDFYDPRNDFGPTNEAPLSAANIDLPEDVANALSNLGLGDPNATQVGSGRGDPNTIPSGGQTGTGSGEKDDRSILQKIIDDFAAVPGNIARDIRMGIDAGFYTDFEVARKRLMDTGKYTKEEVDSWVQRTKDTAKENQRKMAEQQRRDDDDSPMSTSPVDPCPPGFKLDPASGICVPVEEAEEEGSSISLNRARDTEFNELDDIMKRIVKPVDDPVGMQAGGSVGLNRAADNFLAAMGA
tara:strand:- start:45 stop:1559 length:1515 start_codon:yes stop_codon:yes gene_type:complete